MKKYKCSGIISLNKKDKYGLPKYRRCRYCSNVPFYCQMHAHQSGAFSYNRNYTRGEYEGG